MRACCECAHRRRRGASAMPYERRRAWSSASPVADVLNGIGYHAPTDRLIVRARQAPFAVRMSITNAPDFVYFLSIYLSFF